MDGKVEPPMKKRKTNPTSPSFSSIPDEIVVNCLARISKSHYRSLSLVSKSFRLLLSSPELYTARSQLGNTEPCLYIRRQSRNCDRWFTLDQTLITNGEIKNELSLVPIRPSSSTSRALLNSTAVAVGYEIYQIGGTIKGKRSKAVRVLDCRNHTWRRAPNMAVGRRRAKSWFLDGKIYVMGGCSRTQQRYEVFDLKNQTWKPLPSLSNDGFDLKHTVSVIGGKIYVLTTSKNYAYDSKEGRWKELLEESLGPEPLAGCYWCVIENVRFNDYEGKFNWYDSDRKQWIMVKGLEYLYMKWPIPEGTNAIKLAEYCGKLVIMFNESVHDQLLRDLPNFKKFSMQKKRIRCAVIRLEKRIGLSGLEIWGHIERMNAVLKVPSSYNVLSCVIL